jgi:hypothetical protein
MSGSGFTETPLVTISDISDAYYSHPPRTRLCGEPGQRPDWLPPVCPRPRLPLQLVHQAGQELARGCCCPPSAAAAILISGGGRGGEQDILRRSNGKCRLAAVVPVPSLPFNLRAGWVSSLITMGEKEVILIISGCHLGCFFLALRCGKKPPYRL